jgi:hypothetical protein
MITHHMMKVETPFFQFYEFVLFLVSFVMHTAKVLMPLSDFKALQTECFRLDENTIKTITLLNLQLSINVCNSFLRC